MQTLLDFFHHFDRYLISFLVSYNLLAYFTIIVFAFLQTGVLIGAFLPGDALIITAGAMSSKKPNLIDAHILFVLCSTAAVSGNLFNYITGKWLGSKLLNSRTQKLVEKENVKKIRQSFHKWGDKIVIIGCLIPFLRSIIPFVSGMVKMPIKSFFIYSAIGCTIWIAIVVYGGFYLNDISMVKNNIVLAFFIIITLTTVLPALKFLIHYLRNKDK